MKYNYVLFDWDGTLASTPGFWIKAIQKIYADHGISLTLKEIVSELGDYDGPKKRGVRDPDKWQSDLTEYGKKNLKRADLYDGALDLLKLLKENKIPTAMVTSSTRVVLEPLLVEHELEALMDAIHTYDDISNHKPDPEQIHLAIKTIEADPAKTVLVGDSDKDILAAHNAGIDVILFHDESHHRQQLKYDTDFLRSLKPTHEVSALSDIAKIIGIS